MTSRTPTAQGARLTGVLQGVVDAAGYDLEQVSVSRVGRRSLVRVVVDADDGVSLDDVAELSRVISDALDDADRADALSATGLGAYTLEVTSPGVDRSLTELRHWRRAIGRLVRTRIGDRAVEGRVVSADDLGIALEVGSTVQVVPYADLGPGSIQVEFAHPDALKGLKS